MIVDLHAHYHPRAYQTALSSMPEWGGPRGFGGGRFPDTDGEGHIERRVAMMAEAGVRMQVLSPAAGWAPYSADSGASVNAAHTVNDAAAEVAARYPGQFKALVSLPLPHMDAALEELRRAHDDLGMIGVNLHCSVLDRSV